MEKLTIIFVILGGLLGCAFAAIIELAFDWRAQGKFTQARKLESSLYFIGFFALAFIFGSVILSNI